MTPSEILELKAYAAVVYRERAEIEGRCRSKAAFGTRAQAERTIRRVARKAGVVAYKCQFADHWHVGSRGVR